MTWLWLVLCLFGVGESRATELTQGPVVEVAETTAVVRWTTDVECGTQVKFGRNPNNLNRHEEGAVGVKHEVWIADLLQGTPYFYTIGTAKRSLQTGTFLTKGTPQTQLLPDSKKGKPLSSPFVKKPAVKSEPKSLIRPTPKLKPSPAAGLPLDAPPPTARTWGDRRSLPDHYQRHGADFGASSPDDYAAQAWLFLQRAKSEGLPAKQDESDGTVRVWEGKTRTFAAYNRDFTTKTFFKPGSADYFTRQPGKPVRLSAAPAAP